jgi:hypothetical protein
MTSLDATAVAEDLAAAVWVELLEVRFAVVEAALIEVA